MLLNLLKYIPLRLSLTGFVWISILGCLWAQPEKIYVNLEEATQNPEKVFHLVLNGHTLPEFPREILNFSNLQTLDLSGTFANPGNIAQIPEAIAKLKLLIELNLRYNQIQEIPEGLCQLVQLNTLYLSSNKISRIPQSLTQLKNLQFLDLSDNQLKEFPEYLIQLPKLEELNLSRNQAEQLPNQLGSLKALIRLDVSDNAISTLPQSIGKLTQLSYLDARQNQLHSLPISLAYIDNLGQLRLDDNPFEYIPEELELWLSEREYGNSLEIPPVMIQNRIQAEKTKKEAILQAQIAQQDKKNAINQARLALQEKQSAELESRISQERQKLLLEKSKSLEKDSTLKAAEIASLKRENELSEQATINQQQEARLKSQKTIQLLIISIGLFIIVAILTFLWLLNQNRLKQQTINKELLQTTEELEASRETLQSQAEDLLAQKESLEEKTQELEALAEELRQQNEVVEQKNIDMLAIQSTKDLMISAINHDLRNPLNPIINYSSPNFPIKDKEVLLQRINFRSKRMKAMVEDVMYIYQAERLELPTKVYDLHKTVKNAINLIAGFQSQMPEIINEVPRKIYAEYNEDYIRRVVENLLVNAVKYSNGVENPKIYITAKTNQAQVSLQIKDNGWGIPEKKLNALRKGLAQFETKRNTAEKSFGIGLRFCTTVLRIHKSHLEIHSDGEDQGSTFCFSLPLVHKSKEPLITSGEPLSLADTIEAVELSPEVKEQWSPYIDRLKQLDLYDPDLGTIMERIPKDPIENTALVRLFKECVKLDEEVLYQKLLYRLSQ